MPATVFRARPSHPLFQRIALLLSLAAIALSFSLTLHPKPILMPPLVLWAWERPEDLRFIDPATTGVAYLAATVNLQPDGAAKFHYRQQPLRLPNNASIAAVVRIESPQRYTLPNPASIAAGLVQLTRHENLKSLQIDYDARASERAFYRALLADLHRQTTLPIGITALASWCDGDPWLDTQPLSEAVPMFFSMGRYESKDMPLQASPCTHSIGLSTGEPWPATRPRGLRTGARIYVFNPRSWTKPDYNAVLQRIKDWK